MAQEKRHKMFQNYDIFNAVTFFVVFLFILEALNFATGRQMHTNINPQMLILLMSLFMGIVSGYKVKDLSLRR